MVSDRYRSLYRRSIYIIEAFQKALYTLNSPPVVSVNLGGVRVLRGFYREL